MSPGADDSETLDAFLSGLAMEFAGLPALLSASGDVLSHAELLSRVGAVAGGLGPRRRAHRMAIVMANGPDMSIALLAVMSVCVAVPLNPSYTEPELETYLIQAGVTSLLVAGGGASAARTVAARLGIEILDYAQVDGPTALSTKPQPDDVGIILLTSGTTGRSKLVPLTHRNLTVGARNVAAALQLSPDDRVLSMWEQYHVGGVVDLLLAPLAAGSSIVSAGGFDTDRALALVEQFRPTWFQGVPTTLRALYHRARELRPNWHGTSLRLLRSVAAALPPEWMRDLEDCFGVPVIQTFGMTEAAPLITTTRLPPAIRKPNSTGLPCGTTIAILDGNGDPLSPGTPGEVAVRGANVFSGYLDDPDANAAAFRKGWFLTGDLGFIDADGELFLSGRTKDLINRGGEKISPREVEEALLAHPSVEQVAVFAVQHPTLGEDIGAAVVLRRGRIATIADIETVAGERLAPFKVPHRYLFLPNLPKSSVGKVLRSEVAALYSASLAGAGRTAPANGLEAALARIWADELDLDSVGVEDAFVELGGDSLSSVRILLAAETLLAQSIPADAARHFSTIRRMADYLVESGCATEPPFRGGSIGGAMTVAVDKLQGHPLDPQMLATAQTLKELQVARHAAENVATPAELSEMLSKRWLHLGRMFSRPSDTYLQARERRKTRVLFHGTLIKGRHPMEWSRRPLGAHADLFTGAGGESQGRTLVVSFAGRAMRLLAPTYGILCALDPRTTDLLLLRDPTRQHYLSGVAGIGGTIEAVARWADEYARSHGYARVVAFGTSSGGIPAICTALLNRWQRVLAVGADQVSLHRHLEHLLTQCAALMPDAGTKVLLAYSGQRERDRLGAAEIAALLPAAQELPDQRFHDHALLYRLQERGELGAFFDDHLLS